MCGGCGGKSTRPAVSPRRPAGGASKAARLALAGGAGGLVMLEYIGGNFGSQSFYGPVTMARYVVSARSRLVGVDPRDLETGSARKVGLLQMTIEGRPVFRRYQAIQKPVAMVDPEPEPSPEPSPEPVEETPTGEWNGETPLKGNPGAPYESPADFLAQPAGEISLSELSRFDRDILRDLLELEKSGRARKSVIAKIEQAREAL